MKLINSNKNNLNSEIILIFYHNQNTHSLCVPKHIKAHYMSALLICELLKKKKKKKKKGHMSDGE